MNKEYQKAKAKANIHICYLTMGKGSTEPVFKKEAGAYGTTGYEASKRIAQQLESLLGQDVTSLGGPELSTSEQSVLDSVISQTQGTAALRGVDVTPGAIAQSIAPTLANVRQQQIGNLLQQRGQNIGGLLELTGYAMPQLLVGQKGKSASGPPGSPGMPSVFGGLFGGGGASGLFG